MQPVATGNGVRPAILSGWLYVPYEAIGGREARERLKRRLTFRPRFQEEDAPKLISMFHDWHEREYLGVPRAWGLETYRGRLPLLDKTLRGAHEVNVPKLPDFYHPRVLNPQQQEAFHNNIVAQYERGRRGFIAKAGTGTGKTVVSLRVAGGHIRRPTLVLVHLERLMWQWAEEVKDKLGVPEERIGIVQSDTCDFQDRDFVVGMLHSVAQRDYGKAFYRHFGLCIFDEVHKVGTQFFAPVAYRFPSYNWLGLSATVERPDGGEKVFFYHLGGIAVTSRAEAMPMEVRPIRYTARRPLAGRSRSTRMKALAADIDRNRWLVRQIVEMYDEGRDFIAVSEYVEHVQTIMDMCAMAGIPREHMGQFTGQRHEGPFCPLHPVLNDDGEVKSFLPVRDDKGRPIVKVRKLDISDEELTRAKTQARITFCTYGMIVEGIDESRWSAGIDLLPRGRATQLIGRVRRPLPGKPDPYWRTPFDTECAYSRGMFAKRCGDYRSSGATIKEMA